LKCSKCAGDAVIFLPYAKTHLCERDFNAMFEKRFRATIRDFKMIKKGEHIAVALSGGKDSTVLMHLLHRLKEDLPFELVAVTIDEGIKGYRSNSLAVAEKEAKALGIEHKVFSFKDRTDMTLDGIMEKKGGKLPCSYCGVIRRYLINTASREMNADKVAVGHNLDDMAQTVMMNLMRNEPMRLARLGDPIVEEEKLIARIRPLLRSPEKEIAVYAMLNNISLHFQECPYARHAFRAHVREQLNATEERYPGTKFRILNSFLAIQPMLRRGIESAPEMKYCKTCKEPSGTEQCMFCTMLEEIKEGGAMLNK
jgi:uncharacterized protein (TIGR00269 family)